MNWTPEELEEALKANPDLGLTSMPKTSKSEGFPQPSSSSRPTHSKYGNQRTEYNGVTYDSKREAKVAAELDMLVAAGEITFWLRQVSFPLPGGIVYRADFVTFIMREHSVCEVEVVEVKGHPTKEWTMKEKLFRERYSYLTLRIVR